MKSNLDPYRILLISDDAEAAHGWSTLLRSIGLVVVTADSPKAAFTAKEEDQPDIFIIDENTPYFDGILLCRELRREQVAPILMLMQNTTEFYLLEAYKGGVDVCLVKPVSPALFLAQVRVLIKWTRTVPMAGLENLIVGHFQLDPTYRTVTVGDGPSIKLSILEYRLLFLLMQHPGWVYKPEDIIPTVWGYLEGDSRQLVKHLIFRLRRKIELDPKVPRYIHTVAGVGYKFQLED
jgi:DNA-binding response OmpR family regulator